jgi:hypothetical protein
MKVTRTIVGMMLFLSGCGGCGSCENADTHPTGGAPAPAAAGPTQAPAKSTEPIHAAAVEPTVAAKPTARPVTEAAEKPAQAPAPPAAGAPEPPQADDDDCIVVADANPDYGPPPLAVAFSAEAECTGGEPKYDWDFGDGSPHSSEVNPSHTYPKAGEYTAVVTVTGRGDASANDEIDITVEEEGGEGGGTP